METHSILEGLSELRSYIGTNRNVDLDRLDSETVQHALSKRLSDVGAANCGEYLDRLEVDAQEFRRLFQLVFPSKTIIQADPALFSFLVENIFSSLFANSIDTIRLWSVGCGTGEEAYSLAIAIAETLGINGFQQ